MSAAAAYVAATGVVCPIGIGSAQASASFRAGLSAFSESSVHNREFEPIRMALLPEDALPPLADALQNSSLTTRQRRLLRLLSPALAALADSLPSPEQTPLYLALPGSHPGIAPPDWAAFFEALQPQTGLAFDQARSKLFLEGRAGGLLALEAALDALPGGPAQVVVAGADSFLDLRLLATLDQDGRILGERVMDGFIPGEAAACLLLTRKRPTANSVTQVVGATSAQDPGHRYGEAPALGEGLAQAIEAMRSTCSSFGPVHTVFAGLNGESFGAKEWGVARIRHSDLLAEGTTVEHPADCYGDVGAATGPLLMALADETLRRGDRRGPALVWASSDTEAVGCAGLEVAGAAASVR